MSKENTKVSPHPTSIASKDDRLRDKENIARQMRTSQMMREAAREQINPTQVISELQNIDLELQGEKDSAGNKIPLEREIISALKARADIKFKLLDKVLPNLKATESTNLTLHDHAHAHIHNHKVSDVELAQRLQMWRKNKGFGHMMRTESNDEESCVEATFEEVSDTEYDFL